MIWDWVKGYLQAGVVVVAFEWAVLAIGRRRIFEPGTAAKQAAEAVAFLLEILIWPRQVFVMIWTMVHMLKGELPEELQEEFEEGFVQGQKIRRRWQERKVSRK